MAFTAGARGTLTVSQANRRIDVDEKVMLLEPSATPLCILSKRLNKKATHNPRFDWFEDALDNRFATGSAQLVGDVALTITPVDAYQAQDLVQVTRTGEVIRVVSNAAGVLVIVRGVGSTAAAINAGDELLLLSSAAMEGDVSKVARSTNVTQVFNYTQIFRKPVESTRTQIQSDQYAGPNDWDRQLAKAGIEHMKDIEYAVLFGTASEDTSGAQPRRSTRGAVKTITTNVTAAGGVMTEASFFNATRPAFRYGSHNKLLIGSPLVISVLNQYAQGKIQIPDQSATTYGMNVTRYISPFGAITVVPHWLLEGSKYAGYALILDMDQLSYRYLANEKGASDTHIRKNIQAPDADTEKDEYLTECGLEFGQEKMHTLITGVTG